MATTTPKLPPKRPANAKRAGRPAQLSNQALLKLAAKNRPPQSWYDETENPLQPKR